MTSTDPTTTEVLQRVLEFEPALGSFAVPVVVLAVGVLVSVTALRRELDQPGRRAALLSLRLLTLAVLSGLLAFPTWRESVRLAELPTVAVVIDTSASMSLPGDERNPATTRLGSAVQLVGAPDGVVAALAEQAVVRVAAFGDELQTLAVLDPERQDDGALDAALTALAADAERTPLLDAVAEAARAGAGRRLAGVVLLSDGNDNVTTDIQQQIARLAELGTPVVAVGLGGRPAVDVSVEALQGPDMVFADEDVTLVATLAQRAATGEVITVRLRGGEQELTQSVTLHQPLQRVEFTTRPPAPAEGASRTTRYDVVVDPLPDERDDGNNGRRHDVQVLDEPVRVLALEELPRWEWRFVHDVLQRQERTRGAFDTVMLESQGGDPASGFLPRFPTSVTDLAHYDLVIVGDVDLGTLRPEVAAALADYVSHYAGSVLFVPGRLHGLKGYDTGDVRRMLPVASSEGAVDQNVPFRLATTAAGDEAAALRLRSSPGDDAILWRGLPGHYRLELFREHAQATTWLRVASGTHDLGVRPVLSWRPYGKGTSALLAIDSTWRWRSVGHGERHARFWGQMVRWLGLPHMLARLRTARLTVTPDRARVGQRVSVRVQVPVDRRQADELLCAVEGPAERLSSVVLRPNAGDPGTYTGSLRVDEPGRHRLRLSVLGSGELEAELSVAAPRRELDATAVDRSLLEALCLATGGALVSADANPATWLDVLDLSPEEVLRTRRQPAWNLWPPLLALLALLAGEWTLRKAWRLR